MTVTKSAVVGTLESGDIQVEVSPREEPGIEVDLSSIVIREFGCAIRERIIAVLTAMCIESATVVANDHGALDCTISSRVQTAALRACESGNFNWEARP